MAVVECTGADPGEWIETEAVVELVVDSVGGCGGGGRSVRSGSRLSDTSEVVEVKVESVEIGTGFGCLERRWTTVHGSEDVIEACVRSSVGVGSGSFDYGWGKPSQQIECGFALFWLALFRSLLTSMAKIEKICIILGSL